MSSVSSLLPHRSDYALTRHTWPVDIVAGLTVGIVALPLALAFGVTSGVGAAAGLITAVVAGGIAAVFGGSHVAVSGPTGAMTVVLVPIVHQFGAEAVYWLAILAGAVVVLLGVLKLGRVIALLPWPVVEGFTVGIATVIGLQQVPLALGIEKPEGENTALVALASFSSTTSTSATAITVTVLTIAIIAGLMRFAPRWPAALIALVIVTTGVYFGGTAVPTIGELPDALPHLVPLNFDFTTIKSLLSAAVAVAALAAIESLLSAKVADGLSDDEPSHPDRELVGQGLANIASGLLGGMPATGAIARTAVNVRSGGRTRLASIIHAAFLLIAIAFGSQILVHIPLPALAGILLVTAYRMVEARTVRSLLKSPRSEAAIFVITAVATVALDLIVAVELGIAIAAVMALRSMSNVSRVSVVQPDAADYTSDELERELLRRHIGIYRFDGALFFGAAQRFLDDLADTENIQVLVLRLENVAVIDTSGAHALHEVIKDMARKNVSVILSGIQPMHLRALETVGISPENSRIEFAEHVHEAISRALEMIKKPE